MSQVAQREHAQLDSLDISAKPLQAAAPIEMKQYTPAPAPAEASSVLAMIGRLADPSAQCDIERLERLMALYDKERNRAAELEFNTQFAAMQGAIPYIPKRGYNNNTQSKFAKWEDVVPVIMPVLARYGFSLTFSTDTSAYVSVTAELRHSGGHAISTNITLAADTSGKKNEVHSIASSISYAKRYAAFALLNLVAEEEDDDGNGAGTPPQVKYITAAQRDELRRLLDSAPEATQAWFFTQVDDVAKVPAHNYDKLRAGISAAIKKANQGV